MVEAFWRDAPDEGERRRWDAFVEASRTGHYQQTAAWGAIHARRYKPAYFWMERGGEIASGALVLAARTALPGQTILRAPRGPVCDEPGDLPETLEALCAACARHGGMRLEVNPNHLRASGAEEILSAKGFRRGGDDSPATLYVDLTREPEAILAGFRQTTRHEIVKFSKRGGKFRYAESEADLEEFVSLFASMPYYGRYDLTAEDAGAVWKEWLADRDRAILLLSYYEGRATAGIVVVRVGGTACYVWGASLKQERGAPQSHALQWEAMLWARRHGCTVYDFGAASATVDPDSPTYGVRLFKAGFSKDVVEWVRPHRRVLKPLAYGAWSGLSGLKETARRGLKRGKGGA